MSRSRKKSPFIGNTTAETEKPDKKQSHKRHRKQVKQRLNAIIQHQLDEDELLELEAELPMIEEISNPWDFAKDGKHRVDLDSIYLRK